MLCSCMFSVELHISAEALQKRWKDIGDTFATNLKKSSGRSGDGASEVPPMAWPLWNSMH